MRLPEPTLDAAPIGIAVVDARRDGRPVVYANAGFEALTGFSATESVGRPLDGLVGEHSIVREDGTTIAVEVSVGEADAEGHAIAVLTDVTAHVEVIDRLATAEIRYERLIDDLTAAELRYRELVEQIPAVVYVADFNEVGALRYISPQIGELLGPDPGAFVADPELWYRHVHPDDLERYRAEERRTFEAEETFDLEFRMVREDGRVIWAWERDTIVRGDDGTPLFTQGVLVDITAQRQAEEDVREERDRAQRYLDLAGMAVVVLGTDERIALLNRAGHQLLGYDEGTLLGHNWFDTCIPDRDREVARPSFHRLLGDERDPIEPYESAVLTREGNERIVRWNNTILRDERGQVTATLSSGVDVTERRQAEAQIAYLAYHDSLTGLPNRALLREHLELALARARRNHSAVALLYIDLDDFKLVNDSLGHAAGDELLCRIAMELRTRTRETDLLARQGGDEFLLLLSDVESDAAPAAAEAAAGQVMAALADPFTISGAEFHIGASVGISLFPRDAKDAESLLKHADAAMYQAKAAGRNEITVYAADAGRPLERLSMTTRLRRAIAESQLALHWQPVVVLQDDTIRAIEALVRWNDPERGELVLPNDFVPFAEDTGLIDRLGDWVVDALVEQRQTWRAAGLDPPVTFNVSPRQLRRAGFAGALVARLSNGELDLDRVTVEITESAAVREDTRIEPLLQDLHAAGLRVAIDDFGAGWSSLARLRDLPVQMVKIDRSFLADVPASEGGRAIVTAIQGLADALGMDAVAEGVETEEQREFLVGRGFHSAQGFLLGRPVPAGDLEDRLRQSPACSMNRSSNSTNRDSSRASSRTGAAERS